MSATHENHSALARCVFIAGRLRNNKPVNCTDVAREFGVSLKTAWRDFEFLRDRCRFDLQYNARNQSFRLIKAPEAVLL